MNSPFKSTLLQLDLLSSSKKVVSCEINGWMETHAKPTLALPPPPHSKFIRNVKIMRSPTERTNFSKLKEMRCSLLKNTMRKFSERTPLTAQSSNPLSGSGDNSITFQSARLQSIPKHGPQPLKIIQVSEFQAEEHHTISQPSVSVGSGKISLLRLRALSKKGTRPNINHLLLGKEADIIQSKVTDKQYCGLKFVTRRLTSKLRP